MVATLYLLGCILVPGQTAPRPQPPAAGVTPARLTPTGGNWVLVPRLHRSQELVYRGTFHEDGQGGRVQFSRDYRIETHMFVMDTPPRGAEVALLTVLKHRPSSGEPPSSGEVAASSVRLERVQVDLQGKVTADAGVRLMVPLEGAPTLDCGAFVALPGGRISVGQEWLAVEEDRPPITWRAVGTEMMGGNTCIKLVGEQKSDDWDRPRADRTAWHRKETVWLVPNLGLAYRVERQIEQREPAHREATQKSVLRVEMESNFQLSGEAGDSRRREITQALSLRDTLTPLLTQPTRYDQHLSALLKKIDYYLEQPPTPYRPAILQVKRRAEAARRGETPPEPIRETRPATPAVPVVATLGQPAPDFIATNLSDGGSAQLRRWTGKPILLVFYHPSSATTPTVLRYAQQLLAAFPQRITVVGMCVSEDAQAVRKQRAEMKLTFPILSGGGLRGSYGVETTPKLILLDSSNIVRGEYLGWGRETPREVHEELKRWLPIGIALPSAPRPQQR